MSKRTPLYARHVQSGARMIDFGGWTMPLQYSGIVNEHRAVRQAAGLFDISHMGQFEVVGPEAKAFLDCCLTNDLRKISPGWSQYSLLCNEAGGVIDDLYVYHTGPERFVLMVNAARQEEDFSWLSNVPAQTGRSFDMEIRRLSPDFGAIAVQGPATADFIDTVFLDLDCPNHRPPLLKTIKKNQVERQKIETEELWISRTGYTGEDGFEIMSPSSVLAAIWERILKVGRDYGLQPAGLGARDTLRTEACYPLYGHELSETITPLEAGLGRFVNLDKGFFIGQTSLRQQQANGTSRKSVAFKMMERGPVPRAGCGIFQSPGEPKKIGSVTSGTQSPTYGLGIGLGYISSNDAQINTQVAIEIRGALFPAQIVAKPLYRRQPLKG